MKTLRKQLIDHLRERTAPLPKTISANLKPWTEDRLRRFLVGSLMPILHGQVYLSCYDIMMENYK